MITGEHIDAVVKTAARRFEVMLEGFRLAEGANAFPERNLTFQFGHAFLERFPEGAVFLEPAFDGTKHLDGLFIAGDAAIALECKRLWMPTQVSWIEKDVRRLSEPLFRALGARFVPPPPRRWYAMLLVEAWNPDHLEWWKGDPGAKCAWRRPAFLGDYVADGFFVRKVRSTEGAHYPLYWLYAYRAFDTWGA